MKRVKFNLGFHDGESGGTSSGTSSAATANALSTPVAGKKIIYLYRIYDNAATDAGAQIAFVSENGLTISKDADSTKTKSGAVRTPGVAEIEHTVTSLLQKGDSFIEDLKEAFISDKLIEVWRVNLEEPVANETNKYKGTYYQAYITEFEESSNAEDMVELTMTFGVNGKGADGDVTVTSAQMEVADYVFRDTPATGA